MSTMPQEPTPRRWALHLDAAEKASAVPNSHDDFSWRSTGPVDMEEIFRAMIDCECRDGRLSRARRRRIVRYGAQLGLSGQALGEMVERALRRAEEERCAGRRAQLHLNGPVEKDAPRWAWVSILAGAMLLILGFCLKG